MQFVNLHCFFGKHNYELFEITRVSEDGKRPIFRHGFIWRCSRCKKMQDSGLIK